ncbi:hypothetical protein D3C87_1390950 [compost metagenome]
MLFKRTQRVQPAGLRIRGFRIAEFRILIEMKCIDDAVEHVCRSQYPQLAFDIIDLHVELVVGSVDIIVHDPEIGRIDEDLRADGEFGFGEIAKAISRQSAEDDAQENEPFSGPEPADNHSGADFRPCYRWRHRLWRGHCRR